MKSICVIGCGGWGQNHIRTLYEMGNLAAVVDTDPARIEMILEKYPVKGYNNVRSAVSDGYDGYVIATPASTHFSIAKSLLEKSRNVLVEKPMTLKSQDSLELIRIAKDNGARLMVGHLLLFHPAYLKIKELIDDGMIGGLYHIYSNRLNFGTVRREESVFSSFAPHDISIVDYLIGKPAVKIEAKGAKYLQNDIFDFTMCQLSYPGNINAHIFTSWLHPFKEQRLVVVGSKGMLSYDDASEERQLFFYDRNFSFTDNGILCRNDGTVQIIPYVKSMALENELKYFVDNLDGEIRRADGLSGYEVVKVIERVDSIIKET